MAGRLALEASTLRIADALRPRPDHGQPVWNPNRCTLVTRGPVVGVGVGPGDGDGMIGVGVTIATATGDADSPWLSDLTRTVTVPRPTAERSARKTMVPVDRAGIPTQEIFFPLVPQGHGTENAIGAFTKLQIRGIL